MSMFFDEEKNPKIGKMAGAGLAAIFAVSAVSGSFYSVDPTEMANVRRLSHVMYEQPIGSGLHLKAPFIDTVDKVQTSLTTLHIPPFEVNTVDNQKITLDLNFNYTTPKSAVNHLLYEVGKSGNADVTDSIIPVAMDRAGRVFATKNTTNISKDREAIQAEVTKQVFDAVKEQFGLQPHSLQFAKIGYSDAFIQSNELAVRAKNEAIAEQNRQNVATAVAQQAVIKAQGERDSAIASAEGRAKSALIEAEANKKTQELTGEGNSSRIASEIKPFGTASLYVDYLKAQATIKAADKWDGTPPQVFAAANGNGSSPIVVPIPLQGGPK